MVTRMVAENTINGSFGTLHLNGENLANVRSIEYNVALEREELMIAGSRNKQYKAKGVMGTGNFVIYKVTSLFVAQMKRAFASPAGGQHALASRGRGEAAIRSALHAGYWLGNNNLGEVGQLGNEGFSLRVDLDDPEQFNEQNEVVTLQRVKLWNINGGFSVDDLIEQTIEFTFEGFDDSQDLIRGPGQTRTAGRQGV